MPFVKKPKPKPEPAPRGQEIKAAAPAKELVPLSVSFKGHVENFEGAAMGRISVTMDGYRLEDEARGIRIYKTEVKGYKLVPWGMVKDVRYGYEKA